MALRSSRASPTRCGSSPASCGSSPTTRASAPFASWATGAWSARWVTRHTWNEPNRSGPSGAARHLPTSGEEQLPIPSGAARHLPTSGEEQLPMNGEDKIRADLEARLGARVLAVEPIPEGHSGFTYFVSAESGEYVLRLPPPNARIAGTADGMRQGRIMAALHDAGLPAPAGPVIRDEPLVGGPAVLLIEPV